MQETQAKTISVVEFSALVGIGQNSVRTWLNEGRIRHVRVGRRIRIPVAEVDGLIARESHLRSGKE